ncbi:VOC family protein [Halomarina rubra]|uniref:VOC family protein n=1 Tax=Halomarina rubra TaxID=2071873 RepID=A0ABD6AVQ4_9EURY|nr:VOC family protein [Halomarina rubra]
MTHAISWFEIPATDLERAREFYTTVLDRGLVAAEDTDEPYLLFETGDGEVGGGLFEAGEHDFDSGETMPFPTGEAGPTVYLTVDDSIDAALDRVETAGGTVLVGTTAITETLHYALIRDTEGNRVGLMAME